MLHIHHWQSVADMICTLNRRRNQEALGPGTSASLYESDMKSFTLNQDWYIIKVMSHSYQWNVSHLSNFATGLPCLPVLLPQVHASLWVFLGKKACWIPCGSSSWGKLLSCLASSNTLQPQQHMLVSFVERPYLAVPHWPHSNTWKCVS